MRLSGRTGVFHAFRMMVLLVAAGVLASCADAGRTPPPVPVAAAPATAAPAVSPADASIDTSIDYALGVGDRLRVIVFGEPDLSGEFDVSGSGNVALPLIGQVRAKDLTLSQFEDAVEAKFSEGYLNNPRVSVEVLNYRPFYIYGEVENSGQYPYTNGMTVLNAVAVAGGYTYRANTDRVYITRGDGTEQEYPASQSVKVLPGDVVRVPERFF
ncbi:polysaccharide biosynthesis/export family protein [Parvibaculum sp.]|uniref:polysaccharide biosynthesis/export family protein n=1 Tax=Parvibaculum sp. TaxID=2024848 RepID=UPI00391C0AE7